jgi:3-hydroxyacyl-CoA dehydrogenase
MTQISYQVSDGIALIVMDSPPVNALGLPLRRQLAEAMNRAMTDPGVRAVVLQGSGKGFSGGADIAEFGSPQALAEPSLPTIVNDIESSPKPVVAVISGVCMGGGLELALACHYRVGQAGAKIALPEVKLGILPGAGGTQRLPRVIGVEAALNMIVSGATVDSEKLSKSGLFDRFTHDDPRMEALSFAAELAAEGKEPRRVRDIVISYPHAEAFFQFARTNIKAMTRNYPAPAQCVEAVAAAVNLDFRRGIAREGEIFRHLVETSESRALRHGFFAERAAEKIPGISADTPKRTVRKAAIVGAGTMGSGIAMCFLNAGMPVLLMEQNNDALDAGVARIRGNYASSVKRGSMSEAALDERMALLTAVLSYDELADADLVIEAVFEDLEVKEEVFGKLGRVMKPGAILATNTSTLDVDRIAQASGRPADVVGMHFFSPANIMKLLEVVRGAKTAEDVLATVMSLAKKIRKTAVVSGVCDGFIGNRMLNEYLREAFSMVEEGASPYRIDKAIESWGMAMGPFRMLDLAGNDVHWAVRKRQVAQNPDISYAAIADEICMLGRFGQKTGKGWYLYQPGRRQAQPDAEVEALIDGYRRNKGISARKIGDDEIVERLIYALVDEGARILDEGIAQRASDIDVVYLAGYGFPAFRGGPMFYAGEIGLYNVARTIAAHAARNGGCAAKARPAPLLQNLARDGGTFN